MKQNQVGLTRAEPETENEMLKIEDSEQNQILTTAGPVGRRRQPNAMNGKFYNRTSGLGNFFNYFIFSFPSNYRSFLSND